MRGWGNMEIWYESLLDDSKDFLILYINKIKWLHFQAYGVQGFKCVLMHYKEEIMLWRHPQAYMPALPFKMLLTIFNFFCESD